MARRVPLKCSQQQKGLFFHPKQMEALAGAKANSVWGLECFRQPKGAEGAQEIHGYGRLLGAACPWSRPWGEEALGLKSRPERTQTTETVVCGARGPWVQFLRPPLTYLLPSGSLGLPVSQMG